jgi:hypothetical protein
VFAVNGIMVIGFARIREPAAADFRRDTVVGRKTGLAQRGFKSRLRGIRYSLGEAQRCALVGSCRVEVGGLITDLLIGIGEQWT